MSSSPKGFGIALEPAVQAYLNNPCGRTRRALSRAPLEFPDVFEMISPFDLCRALCEVFIAAHQNKLETVTEKYDAFAIAMRNVPFDHRCDVAVGLWSWFGKELADTPYDMHVKMGQFVQVPNFTPVDDLIAICHNFFRQAPPADFAVEAIGDLISYVWGVYWVSSILHQAEKEAPTPQDLDEGAFIADRVAHRVLQKPEPVSDTIYEILLGPGEREAYIRSNPISKEAHAKKAYSMRGDAFYHPVEMALRNLALPENDRVDTDATPMITAMVEVVRPILDYAKWYGRGWKERHLVFDASIVARDISREDDTEPSTPHAYMCFFWGAWWVVCPEDRRLKGPCDPGVAIAALAGMRSYKDEPKV